MDPHTRLQQARTARAEDTAALSRRIGITEELLRTIEDGRFEDLPPGIYGRAAIRSYAAALGLDPAEIMTACEPLLPAVADPIAAMRRIRGLETSRAQPRPEIDREVDGQCPDWRVAAAAALDACIVGAVLATLIGSASVMAGAPVAALAGSTLAFAIVSALLGSLYFATFGGVGGVTAGQHWVGGRPLSEQARRVDLRGIAIRTISCATADVRFIRDAGAWLGCSLTARSPVPR